MTEAPGPEGALSREDVVDGVPVEAEQGCQLLDPGAGPVEAMS
jgi:hypothetical protein